MLPGCGAPIWGKNCCSQLAQPGSLSVTGIGLSRPESALFDLGVADALDPPVHVLGRARVELGHVGGWTQPLDLEAALALLVGDGAIFGGWLGALLGRLAFGRFRRFGQTLGWFVVFGFGPRLDRLHGLANGRAAGHVNLPFWVD
jgi:hypothetical protein